MAKKIFYSILLSMILLFTGVVFASSDSNETKSTSLGNEITSSMDRTEDRIDNLVDTDSKDKARNGERNMGDDIKAGAENIGNDVMDGMNNVKNGVEDLMDGDNGNETRRNTAVSGTTGNYNAGETIQNETGGMSQNAWIWIILAVVAIIIIAAVWYYAAQK